MSKWYSVYRELREVSLNNKNKREIKMSMNYYPVVGYGVEIEDEDDLLNSVEVGRLYAFNTNEYILDEDMGRFEELFKIHKQEFKDKEYAVIGDTLIKEKGLFDVLLDITESSLMNVLYDFDDKLIVVHHYNTPFRTPEKVRNLNEKEYKKYITDDISKFFKDIDGFLQGFDDINTVVFG